MNSILFRAYLLWFTFGRKQELAIDRGERTYDTGLDSIVRNFHISHKYNNYMYLRINCSICFMRPITVQQSTCIFRLIMMLMCVSWRSCGMLFVLPCKLHTFYLRLRAAQIKQCNINIELNKSLSCKYSNYLNVRLLHLIHSKRC